VRKRAKRRANTWSSKAVPSMWVDMVNRPCLSSLSLSRVTLSSPEIFFSHFVSWKCVTMFQVVPLLTSVFPLVGISAYFVHDEHALEYTHSLFAILTPSLHPLNYCVMYVGYILFEYFCAHPGMGDLVKAPWRLLALQTLFVFCLQTICISICQFNCTRCWKLRISLQAAWIVVKILEGKVYEYFVYAFTMCE